MPDTITIERPKVASLFGDVRFEPVSRRLVITLDCRLRDQTHVRAVEGVVAKALSMLSEVGAVDHRAEPVESTTTQEAK